VRSEGIISGFAVLEGERDRAARYLNGVRVVLLVLLGMAAATYAPSLTSSLNRVNLVVLSLAIAWAVAQVPLLYRRPQLPPWLGYANSLADLAAVTAVIAAYGVTATPAVALKTPIVDAYFVILASLPVASSTRRAGVVSVLAVIAYSSVVAAFWASGRLPIILDPVIASGATAVSPLDEGAKILLLACVGAVATYATRWQERLAVRYAEAADHGAELKTRLARTELQALKLQLQPHFLFNTLNTITALVHQDPARAERMVSGLSDLLRASLNRAGEEEVPLSRELSVLAHYVEIQRVRFGDRLQFAVDASVEAQGAMVPNLILQPLVENAIRHGISSRASGGHVAVRAAREGEWLRISVTDDGVGEAVGEERREGVGLGNTRARLAQLYGDRHRFEATGDAQGFRVVMDIPFRNAGANGGGA
jgi:signal transduction histidine kinase